MDTSAEASNNLASDCGGMSSTQSIITVTSGNENISNENEKLGFEDERTRANTFLEYQWPYENVISSKKLAKAGFVYSGNGDEVQCFSCGGKVKEWKYSDIAIRRHQELYPNCQFIKTIYSKAPTKTYAISNEETEELPSFDQSQVINESSTNRDCATNATTETTEITSDDEKMKSEIERLQTYSSGWPLESPKPSDLAHYGFFYLQERDKVQCAFCGGCLSHWDFGEDPLHSHLKHFPFCPFIMGKDVGNIPLERGYDTCGNRKWSQSAPENQPRKPATENRLNDPERYGIILHHGPKHPAQASVDARLGSFINWPSDTPVKPKDLAEAGLFYIGKEDYTKCFYCDGGLYDWKRGDNPWSEHSKWFPNCGFVKLKKARENSTIQDIISLPTIYTREESSPTPPGATEIGEIMESSVVKSVLELLVYTEDFVRNCIAKRLRTVGWNFDTADELYEYLTQLKEEEDNKKSNDYAAKDTIRYEDMNIDICIKQDDVQETEKHTKIPSTTPTPVANPTTSTEEPLVCKVCLDNQIEVLFLPCRHLSCCVQCATAMTNCPVCRQPIRASVRVFLT